MSLTGQWQRLSPLQHPVKTATAPPNNNMIVATTKTKLNCNGSQGAVAMAVSTTTSSGDSHRPPNNTREVATAVSTTTPSGDSHRPPNNTRVVATTKNKLNSNESPRLVATAVSTTTSSGDSHRPPNKTRVAATTITKLNSNGSHREVATAVSTTTSSGDSHCPPNNTREVATAVSTTTSSGDSHRPPNKTRVATTTITKLISNGSHREVATAVSTTTSSGDSHRPPNNIREVATAVSTTTSSGDSHRPPNNIREVATAVSTTTSSGDSHLPPNNTRGVATAASTTTTSGGSHRPPRVQRRRRRRRRKRKRKRISTIFTLNLCWSLLIDTRIISRISSYHNDRSMDHTACTSCSENKGTQGWPVDKLSSWEFDRSEMINRKLISLARGNASTDQPAIISAKKRNKLIKSVNGNRINSLKVVHWNVGSKLWCNKLIEIEALLISEKPHLCFISEANLWSDVDEEDRQIPGHKLILPNTMVTLGHARIVLIVRDDVTAHKLDEFMNNDIATVWVRIGGGRNNSLVIGGVYREHQILGISNRDASWQERKLEQENRWETIVSQWRRAGLNKRCLLIGDINLDYTRWCNPDPFNEHMVELVQNTIEV